MLVLHGLQVFIRVQLCAADDRCALSLRGEQGIDRFSRKHARLHRGVRALNLHAVEETSAAAQQRTAGEGELGQAVVSSLVEYACAVLDTRAALDMLRDFRVVLPALELAVGVEVGVLVAEAHDHAHEHEIGLHVVEESAAERVTQRRLLQGPAQRVLNQSRLELVGRNFPNLRCG